MPVQNSDALIIERGGELYYATTQDFAAFIASALGTSEFRVAAISDRNQLETDGKLSVGDTIMVDNASADTDVTAGWALYQYLAPNVFRKIAEEEGTDIVINPTNLSLTQTATNATVVNSNGDDVVLPSASATNAGLLPAAGQQKLALVTVTASVDLDDLKTKSHAAASSDGTVLTNPITVDTTTQKVGFSITALNPAP